MAGTKIRGITIELGADTSGLSKALKDVNTEIKSTQKQLKDVERLLKLDPKNTELLAQKQRLLSQNVEQTKDKLDALKEAQKQVSAELEKTGKGQEQYDALQREIVVTQRELKEAESAAAGFNATTAKISATASGLSSKFGDLANKTRGLSMAAAGALAGLGTLAVKAANDADELTTLSKQTGIATDELQKMQYASELIDVDTSTIVGSLKKLKKGLESNKKTFDKLGVSVKTWNGQYRGMTDIFYDTVLALSKIPNETERDIVAMELFGKSADELAGIIDDGGAALRALGKEAEDLGVIIPEEELERATELDDALQRAKAEILPALTELGIKLIEAIEPYLPAIQEAIDKICSALQNISPEMALIVGGVLAVTSALSPLLMAFSSLSGIVASVTGGLGGFTSALSVIETAGVVGSIGAVGVALVDLWNNDEEFKTHIVDDWNNLTAMYEEATAAIVSCLNSLGFNISDFSDITSGIWDHFCETIKTSTEGIADWLTDRFSTTFSLITGAFQLFQGGFTKDWSTLWDGVKSVFEGIMDAIVFYFTSTVDSFITKINWITEAVNQLAGTSIGEIPTIYGMYKGVKEQFAEGGTISSGSALVGEQGPEILTVANGAATVTPLDGAGGSTDIIGLLATYLPYLASGNTIVMDSGALVGSIAPDMNAALGTIAIRGGKR